VLQELPQGARPLRSRVTPPGAAYMLRAADLAVGLRSGFRGRILEGARPLLEVAGTAVQQRGQAHER